MAATNINRVVLTGNLTRDPELRSLPSGMSVCSLRIACNTRRKNNSTGEWEDKPNYFDVTVWGAQGENCARFLAKGRPVAIDGRLEWREWEDQEGNKRQSIEIIADAVQFLGGREDGPGGGGGGFTPRSRRPGRRPRLPARRAPTGGNGSAAARRRHPVLDPRPRRPAAAPASAGRRARRLPTSYTVRASARLPRARGSASRQRARTKSSLRERFSNVAKQRSRPTRRRDKKGGPGSGRRKSCRYCRDKVEPVDYKDINALRKFISDRGKIRSRRITGACRRHRTRSRRPSSARASSRCCRTSATPARSATSAAAAAATRSRPRPLGRHAPGDPPAGRGERSASAAPSSTSPRATCATS